MHKDLVRRLAAAEFQHRRPEQGVEGDDVLADEVHLLQRRVGHVGGKVFAAPVQQVFQRGQVANRRVQPDVEVLARRVRDGDAEVGRIAADVPVAHRGLAVLVQLEPFADLVQHLGLQARLAVAIVFARPLVQEIQAAWVGQLEEEMLRAFQHRRRARQRRIRLDQIGRAVDLAADLAVVAVLVLGVAVRAFALDEAVRQEHVLLGVEELLDGAALDQAVGLQVAVDRLRQLVVFHAVGAVPVVEGDVKTVQVRLAPGGDVGDELLRRDAGFFRRNHDRRAVRIVGADEIHLVPAHALEPHPDVGLDVLHDVADVEIAVGVGEGGGDEEFARGHGSLCLQRETGDFRSLHFRLDRST